MNQTSKAVTDDFITESNAHLSDPPDYRYRLWRIWVPDEPTLLFIGLNPSVADERVDDPTIRRMAGFAAKLGFGGIQVCNLFAYRATNPMELENCPMDPVGNPDNDAVIREQLQTTGGIVCCWGTHGKFMGRNEEVLEIVLESDKTPFCLGLNSDDSPAHPLYLPGDSLLMPYPPLDLKPL